MVCQRVVQTFIGDASMTCDRWRYRVAMTARQPVLLRSPGCSLPCFLRCDEVPDRRPHDPTNALAARYRIDHIAADFTAKRHPSSRALSLKLRTERSLKSHAGSIMRYHALVIQPVYTHLSSSCQHSKLAAYWCTPSDFKASRNNMPT